MSSLRASTAFACSFLLAACYTGGAAMDAGTESGATSATTSASATTAQSTGELACEGTLQSVRDTIFVPSCAGANCHDAMSAAGGLDLSVADLESVLVDVASGTCDGKIRVVPGQASGSFLFEKVAGTPDCGVQMPVGGSLSDAQVQCIADWIGTVGSTCEKCGGDVCVNTATDAQNCGGCGQACPEGIGCSDGVCACGPGTQACGGTCADLNSDPAHCGACGMACDAGEVCFAGVCAGSCEMLQECSGSCVNLETSAKHCGTCGNACAAGESCVSGSCGCEGGGGSYAADIEPMFASRCTAMGCHGGVKPAEGLDLRAGAGYGDLVGVASSQCGARMLVEPGVPSQSYALDKVKGVNLCFGTKMPKTGAGLSAAEISAVSSWICGGAAP